VAQDSPDTETESGDDAVKLAAGPVPWSKYFFQTFYHFTLIPMSLATVGLAWKTRPSATEDMSEDFKKFQWTYLSVWCVCVAADWLQGPYVYALYAAYGFSSREIAELFVAGFGSSLVFGMAVGTVADRFGRKKSCMAYCVLYIISCCTKHFKNYQMLMLGRVTGGIATSMLFSCFECWMVSEHLGRNKFSGGLLSYLFGMMFTLMYCVAIFSGLAAQYVADAFPFAPISAGSAIHSGGFCGPFDLAILCNIAGLALIMATWEENYGTTDSSGADSTGLLKSLCAGFKLLVSDTRAMLMGVIVACFEGAMFAFVFNWTPALASEETPPPHGVIFALFMMACMCGASTSTLVSTVFKPAVRFIVTFALGTAAFVIAAMSVAREVIPIHTCFAAFMIFEFCVGLYFPACGVLKSDVVPECVRGTVYNIYRVPLNAVVVGLLLSDISIIQCFTFCACLLLVAIASAAAILYHRAPASAVTQWAQADLDVELFGKTSSKEV